MSLFDSASLVVTPNGYKEDKLYSIKPTDGSGDLVVTRATTATRVNSQGLVELVPYNFITYSEQFNNADWTKTNCSVTSNSVIAPNGTTTADKLIMANGQSGSSADGTGLRQLVDIASSNYTFSIYAKAGEFNTIRFRENQVTGAFLTIDLTTGAITNGDTGQFISPTATLVSNGWYRITFQTPTLTAIYKYSIRVSETGNGTSGIYIWGAQLVQGSSAKEYFPTTDRLDVPRLDYTNSSCPSILVELQRTNVWTNSEDFNSGTIDSSLITYTANTTDTLSPSGTNTADKFEVTTSGGDAFRRFTRTIAIQSFSLSLYVKGNAGQKLQLFLARDSFTELKFINVTLSGEWERVVLSDSFNTTSSTVVMGVEFGFGSNDSVAGQIYYVWGAQLEAGSYATSYIPTTASSVTRNADVISKTGISSLIGQTEGTLFAEIDFDSSIGGTKIIKGLASDASNFIYSFLSGSTLVLSVYNGGVLQCFLTYILPSSGTYKIAVAYKNNDFVMYANGTQVASQTSGSVPTASILYLGNDFLSVPNKIEFYASILWKERLTNAQLAELTTI